MGEPPSIILLRGNLEAHTFLHVKAVNVTFRMERPNMALQGIALPGQQGTAKFATILSVKVLVCDVLSHVISLVHLSTFLFILTPPPATDYGLALPFSPFH